VKEKLIIAGAVAALLAGCVSFPTGPTVMALPGNGMTFDQFRADDADCRHYAFQQIGGTTAQQQSVNSAVGTAAVGTLVGAAAGAAIGGSQGAGVGAGTGLLFGSAIGTGTGAQSGYSTQRQYDNAYIQCMYAKGQSVPVSGTMTRTVAAQPANNHYPPPPSGSPPPPPPSGNPPPPPPGYR
jgi:hypothetical protein